MSTSAVRLLVISGLRFLRRAKGSSLSVYFGLTLGIVSITGVHLLGERVTASLQQLTPAHLAGITHVLTREDLNVRDYVALRDAWRRGAMPGVSALVPMREGQSREGINVVGTDWVAALDLGQNSDISPPLRFEPSPTPVALVSGGVRPRGGELLLNGVRVQVVSRSPATDTGGMAMAAVDIGTAMAILGGDPSHLDGVLVRFEDGWSLWRAALESAMPGISAGLPASAPDPGGSWRVHALASEAPMRGLASAVLFNLGALGSLALLVALLLMFQSAVIWLRRQRAVHGALTGIGVTDRELATGFVLLLVLLGIPAVASGLWTGRWLCEQLLGVMAGASFAATTVALTTAVVVKAILAGLAVCVLGGGLAWWWEHRAGHLPRALGLTFGVAALSLIAGSLLTPASGLLGIFAGIFAAALLAAFSVLPLLRRLKSAIARVRGPLWWRLGLREVVWYPDDLAVACAALSLSLAVSIGVGVMVDSFRQEFTALLDQRLSADVFVTMVAGDGSEQLAVDISALPGISAVHVSGEIPIRVDGLPVQLAFGAMPAMQAARYGLTRALGDNEILLSEGLARRLGLAIGATMTLGARQVTVAGVFPGYGEPAPRIVATTALARGLAVGRLRFDRLSFRNAGSGAVERMLRARDDVRVQRAADIRRTAMVTFESTFATTDALTWLALFVAAVALFNALAGFRLNQQATGKLLETLGWGWRWSLGASAVRASLLGLIAVLIALPLGYWLAWVLCSEVNPRAFGWSIGFLPAWRPVLVPLALAGVAVLLAGVTGSFVRAGQGQRMGGS